MPQLPAPATHWLAGLSDTELAFVCTCRRKHLAHEQQALINAELQRRALTEEQIEALVQKTMGRKYDSGCRQCGSEQWLVKRECMVCGHVEKESGEGYFLAGLPDVLAAILEAIAGSW